MRVIRLLFTRTEYFATVAADVGFVVASAEGFLSPHNAAIAASVSTAAYAISRGIAKHGTGR